VGAGGGRAGEAGNSGGRASRRRERERAAANKRDMEERKAGSTTRRIEMSNAISILRVVQPERGLVVKYAHPL